MKNKNETELTQMDPELVDKYDIEKYRKMKRRKKLYFRLLIGLVALVVLAIIFFIGETIVQKQAEKEKGRATFPISLKGENPTALEIYEGNILVVGDAQSMLIGEDASNQGIISHGLAKPIEKTGDGKILSYSQGGYVVRLDNQKGELRTLKLETQILFCEISDDGYIAVVTFEERFNAALTIYDSNFKEVYKYNESQNYMTAFDFISSKKGVLTLQSAQEGQVVTIVRGLDFRKEEGTEFFEKTLSPGTVVYSVEAQKTGNLSFITNTGCITLDAKGEDKTQVDYTTPVRLIDKEETDNVVALENLVDADKTDLLVLNDIGEEKAKETMNGTAIDLFVDETSIVVLTTENAYVYDHNLKLLDTYSNEKGCTQVVKLDDSIYAMTSEYLYRLSKLETQ